MATVNRYIEKFGREVTIDEDHPLVKLQDEIEAKGESKRSKSSKKGKKGEGEGEGEGEKKSE